ncbi:MAG TPA: hypothetical protein VNA25_24085 [Phycisphaerae bacterium]|nr:hypothetical protein [Phycisphaerae bacterium]
MRSLFLAITAVVSLCGRPVLAVAGLLDAEYGAGFVWDRSADYDPGTVHGSSLGNPNTDAAGNGVWQMEYTDSAGDDLGGADPWYQGATSLARWDSDYFHNGRGTWARDNDLGGEFSQGHIVHLIDAWTVPHDYEYVPILRWLNPVPDPFEMTIEGTLGILWRGNRNLAADVAVDVVVAHLDASDGTTSLLYAETFDKPTHDGSQEELYVPFDPVSLWIEPADELLISLRARGTDIEKYILLADDLTMQMATIPEPSTLTLLFLGLMSLATYVVSRLGTLAFLST